MQRPGYIKNFSVYIPSRVLFAQKRSLFGELGMMPPSMGPGIPGPPSPSPSAPVPHPWGNRFISRRTKATCPNCG